LGFILIRFNYNWNNIFGKINIFDCVFIKNIEQTSHVSSRHAEAHILNDVLDDHLCLSDQAKKLEVV
jgi:hypothetical protein